MPLGLVAKGERFGRHRFRHSLSTWANETTKDITVSQTLLRHSKPEMTAVYTHGNFPKAFGCTAAVHGTVAGRQTRVGGHSVTSIGLASGWDFASKKQQPPVSGCAVSSY